MNMGQRRDGGDVMVNMWAQRIDGEDVVLGTC